MTHSKRSNALLLFSLLSLTPVGCTTEGGIKPSLGEPMAASSGAMHILAAQPPIEGSGGKPADSHYSLWRYYERQAQLNDTRAQTWDFIAEYYEKFPSAFSGNLNVEDHIAHCRAIAEDYKMAANQDAEWASEQRSMMRRDVFP